MSNVNWIFFDKLKMILDNVDFWELQEDAAASAGTTFII